MHLGLFISFLNIIVFVYCGYPPTGDEVQAGSVLLPASRRGRYLANIVRRQAVDGTGIKFNKDADRMNAEAKKKVDVLSEELLPYIIAEQERRTTLYKRVMTAIQNGEKGVTVAEIRNKPPLIIRKGLLYRCPSNRAPKEPDGSGVIMCEENIEPTPIIYDSCLSAEDKELYVAERKYFFCNRRSADSPDLPRNSTSVYGCAPAERTSLNYTSEKCTLEDTDDIVVHFRYYPDRTFKFVSELDPEREVCDHWAPCQVGYIYSLPAPDQAITANELWHDYEEKPGDYSRDEIIPPVPEDTPEEYAEIGEPYELTKKYLIPDGFVFHGLGRIEDNRRTRITINDTIIAPQVNNIKVEISTSGKWMTVKINFDPVTERDFQSYYLRFLKENSTSEFTYKDKVLVLHRAVTQIKPLKLDQLPGQPMNKTRIQLNCTRCTLLNVMLRADDGSITNLDSSKYEMKIYSGKSGEQRFIELDLVSPRADQFGDYYALIQNEDNDEEKLKLLSLHSPETVNNADLYVKRLETAVDMGEHFDGTVTYDCNYCELTDVICNGESAQKEGRVTILLSKKEVSFNFPNFQDEYACVYIGIFKQDDQTAKKEIAIIENAANDAKLQDAAERLAAPEEGEQLVKQIPFQCDDECSVEKLTVNGQKMEESKDEGNTRRHLVSEDLGPRAPRYEVKNKMLTIIFPFFSRGYAGNFMATFNTAKGAITKRVLEIDPPASKKDSPADQNQHTTEEEYPDNSTNGEQEGSSTNPEDQVSSSGASETPEVSSVEPGASSVEPGSSSVEPGSSSVEPGATSAEPVSTEAPTTTN